MASCLSKPLLSDGCPGRKYSSVKVPADQHESGWPRAPFKSTLGRYAHHLLPSRRGPLSFATMPKTDIWAVDFLQTYDLFFCAIFVFVVIELGSRRLVHFGVTRRPDDG
jgi:hypothetical protein